MSGRRRNIIFVSLAPARDLALSPSQPLKIFSSVRSPISSSILVLFTLANNKSISTSKNLKVIVGTSASLISTRPSIPFVSFKTFASFPKKCLSSSIHYGAIQSTSISEFGPFTPNLYEPIVHIFPPLFCILEFGLLKLISSMQPLIQSSTTCFSLAIISNFLRYPYSVSYCL